MIIVPGVSFYTGTSDTGTETISSAYYLSESEVTYELWNTVHTWAISNGYSFANAGTMGDRTGDTDQHPVTTINWRDAIVWCNAQTEWYNSKIGTSFECVYYSDSAFTTPLRNSEDGSFDSSADYPNPGSVDDPYVKTNANGFRLPTTNEWELAAHYISDSNSDGDIKDTGEYYPSDYASGADADYTTTSGASDYDADGDTEYSADVAVYNVNSGSSTAVVKSKSANVLGLYDISGNVSEWCFEWYPGSEGDLRIIRSSSFYGSSSTLRVGWVDWYNPWYEADCLGIRLAKNP